MKSTHLATILATLGLATAGTHAQTILADSYLTSLNVAASTTLFATPNFPSFLDGPLTGSSDLTLTGSFASGTNGQLSFVFNGAGNTFNGNIIVDSGVFRVAGSPFDSLGGFTAPSMTSSDTITINRAGTLTIDDTVANGYTANRFGSVGQRQAVNLAGGTLNLNGRNNASSSVQTFGALTVASGFSTINVIRNSNGSPLLEFSNLSQSSGSLLTFNDNGVGTLGTNATTVSRIKFTAPPTLINGILAGARWSTNASATGDFLTYGADGVTRFTAYTDYAGNDLNTTASTTENGRLATVGNAFESLSAGTTINSLHITGSDDDGSWALGNTLTLTSGMFMRTGQNQTINITSGTLTAGNGTDDIDLHLMIQQGSLTFSGTSVIADNGSSAVTLVKSGVNGGNTLSLSSGSDNTYTGGTYVLDGTLSTGSTANRRYLGTGKTTVDGVSTLTLGAVGATSNVGTGVNADYTAINTGRINIANVNHGGSGDTFNIGANSIISGSSGAGTGLASLTRGTNINLAANAIIGHGGLSAALNLATGTIQNLGTSADLYYGLNASQGNAGGQITIGTGTAFKGISGMRNGNIEWQLGTINVASGTTDVYFQSMAATALQSPDVFTLGNGATAGGIVVSVADVGTLDINVAGRFTISDTAAVFGNTGTGRNVRFVVAAGAELGISQAAGMGSGTGIATALVQNGGFIRFAQGATATDAFNGAVTVEGGGRFDASLGQLNGTGQLTFNQGSIINITNNTGFSGAQATAASVAAGTIVRLNAANPGAAGDTLDSYLSTDSPIYQVFGGDRTPTNPTTPGTTIMTLNRNGSNVGGILTNDLASRTLGSTTNGIITLGANGGVMAVTTGTQLNVSEDIHGAGALIIGTTDIIDGAPKLGIVNLNSTSNAFTGGVIVNAGTLRTGFAGVLGTSLTNQLTVNGGTVLMAGNNQTVGNLTGTGGVISTFGGTLTIGQGDTGGGNYQGSIQDTNGKLTKVGTGTIALSGVNTYTGATTITAGTLLVNGSLATGSAVAVGVGGTLGGTGTVGGATTLNGTLSPGTSPGTLTFSGNLTVNNGSTYRFEGGDLTDVDGILDLNDNWTLTLGTGFKNGGSVTIFTFGTLAASPDLLPTFDISGLGFTPSGSLSLSVVGNDVVLTGIEIIPEPAPLALLALAAGMIGLPRRQRAA